jgi:hypothetical protein
MNGQTLVGVLRCATAVDCLHLLVILIGMEPPSTTKNCLSSPMELLTADGHKRLKRLLGFRLQHEMIPKEYLFHLAFSFGSRIYLRRDLHLTLALSIGNSICVTESQRLQSHQLRL